MATIDYDANLGQRITIQGEALNAVMGAIVRGSDYTLIYIDNMRKWDKSVLRKPISVTGVLRRKKLAPDPVVNEKGEISHGIKGDSYVLEDVTWKAEE